MKLQRDTEGTGRYNIKDNTLDSRLRRGGHEFLRCIIAYKSLIDISNKKGKDIGDYTRFIAEYVSNATIRAVVGYSILGYPGGIIGLSEFALEMLLATPQLPPTTRKFSRASICK